MAKMIIVAALVLVIGVITGNSETTGGVDIETRQLYTACAPMDIVIESLNPEYSQHTGLTEKAVLNAVESRIRTARLFAATIDQDRDRDQYLYVRVAIFNNAFSIRVALYRFVKDIGYGLSSYVAVWERATVGTHGNNGQYILGSVSEFMDHFLAAYLRVNEEHCSR